MSSPRRRNLTIIALVVQLAVALVVLRRQKTEIKTNSDDEGVVFSEKVVNVAISELRPVSNEMYGYSTFYIEGIHEFLKSLYYC